MTNVGPDIIKVLEEKIGSTSLMGFPGSSTVKSPLANAGDGDSGKISQAMEHRSP